MRILFASHRYTPVPGGTERLVQTIAEGAAARGHDVEVVTQREPSTPEHESIGGVRVTRLRTYQLPGVRLPSGYLRFLGRSPADVFHLYGNRIWCVDWYLPWARGFRWAQVLTGLGFYQYAMHPRRWDKWYFERYFPRRAAAFDRYIASTEYEANQLRRWGFPSELLAHLPVGIALEEFERPPDGVRELREAWGFHAPHVAVYAGGFFENKRVDRLVDAVARTKGSWGLVAIGRDLPDSPYCQSRIRELAKERGVELRTPGVLSREDLLRSYFASDAVVLGSQYEGFGLTLLEAMAAERAFVSWNAGAAGELAGLGGGYCVESGEAFARALQSLSDDRHRRQMAARGREAVPTYSQSVMVDRHLRLYEELTAAKAPAPTG